MTYERRQCSQCGATIELVPHLGEGAPEPGDLVVCQQCGARLVYDRQHRLRRLTPGELATLHQELRQVLDRARARVLKKGEAMVRKGKTWLLGAAFIVCCSNAADSVVEDAGDILRDAGEVLSDAGEALRDAGTSDAAAQPMPTVEVACDPYERTLPGSKLTRWYARTKISPGADVDAWLCEHQEFGEVPSCSQTEGCEGDEWPAHLSCVQAAIEMDEVGNVLVLCGLRQETVGNVSGSTWRTLRLKVR